MSETVDIDAWLADQRLPDAFRRTVDVAVRPLAARIEAEHAHAARPIVVGVCGSQGSGKSTIADLLARLLRTQGLAVAVLSLDDLYLSREDRMALASRCHPLLATRGPPATHDPRLGCAVLDALTRRGRPHDVALPRFDKARDTRIDLARWPVVEAPVDVVLFEGWCVGARPQDAAALETPINALERDEDPTGAWRTYVNDRLAGEYQALFARIDMLVLLQAPGFEQVRAWRTLQERKLGERLAVEGGGGETMDEAALARFVMHYERLTRWILEEMPARADAIIRLGPDHEVVSTRGL